MKKGLTLMELLAVIAIIGILTTISIAGFNQAKENALDKEVVLNLKLIRAAELQYRMDKGTYYPSAGAELNIVNINQNLGLYLSAAATRSWNYKVWNDGCAQGTRTGTGGRFWYLTIANVGEPISGKCPLES